MQTTGVREGQRYEADIESGPTPGPTSAPEDDEDEEEELEIRRKRRMSRLFLGALWILSLSVLVVGIVASTNDRTLGGIGVWRWLIFIGLLVPIWRVSTSVFNIGYGILESLGRSRKDRILYFFLPLRIPLLNMFRWGAYTGVWGGLMRNDTGYDVFIYVLKVFIGFILLWLAKALGVGVAKAIALRFYTVQYFDRMQTSLEHEFYLHALATHKPLHPHRPGSRIGSITGRLSNRGGKSGPGADRAMPQLARLSAQAPALGTSTQQSRGDTPMPGAGDTAMKRADFTKLMEELKDLAFGEGERVNQLLKLQRFITTHKPQAAFARSIGKVTAATTEQSIARSAKRLTKLIFKNLARDGHAYLERDDLRAALPQSMVEQAFQMFNPVENQRIVQERCEASIKEVFTQRKDLKRALKDSKTMVGSLRKILTAIFLIAAFFIVLLIFQVQIGNLWVSVTSLIIASAFIFGNTLRIMFETLVRHFSTHPFDVEDKLNVEKIGWCVVKEMTLWQTILMDWKGQYHFMPNSILFNMSVINISRSERLGDEFVLWVDTDTDPVVFEVLWKELEDFRIANPQWFGSWLSVRIQMCPENGLKIRLAVYYELAFNATDLGVAGDARNLMLVKTLSILKSHRVRLVGRHEFSIAQPPETAVGVPLAGLGLPWSTQFGPTAPFNAREHQHAAVPIRRPGSADVAVLHQRNASEPQVRMAARHSDSARAAEEVQMILGRLANSVKETRGAGGTPEDGGSPMPFANQPKH